MKYLLLVSKNVVNGSSTIDHYSETSEPIEILREIMNELNPDEILYEALSIVIANICMNENKMNRVFDILKITNTGIELSSLVERGFKL